MTTSSLVIAQSGKFHPITGVWADSVFNLADISDGSEYWVQLNATPVSTAALKGGPRIMGLTLNILPSFTETANLTMFSLNWPPAFSFTTARPPRPKTAVFHTVQLVLVATDVQTVTIPINTTAGQATPVQRWLTYRTATRAPFGFSWSGAGGIVAFSAPSVTYDSAFTGLSGYAEARGRADECPTCGGKSTRDTWVRDGYSNQMVCPRCYDDEDTVGRHYQGLGSERPGSGEG